MTIKKLQKLCHKIATEKGFWDIECIDCGYTVSGKEIPLEGCPECHSINFTSRNNAELLMLMVTELGEACEALRHGDWEHVREEVADCVIRIMDFCEARDINLEEEISKKIEKNKKRPYRHGKQF